MDKNLLSEPHRHGPQETGPGASPSLNRNPLASRPPQKMLRRPKSFGQRLYDAVGIPFRMVLLPDHVNERWGWTSLRAERLAAVLPELKGRVLDVGAGDNLLVRLYRENAGAFGQDPGLAQDSVGADVHDWGGGCVIVDSSARLPFPDQSFDTVCFLACLNHIPEREAALSEARRLLKPGGRLVVTMIGRWVGRLGHALWWYSEEKERHVDEDELPGMDRGELIALVSKSGYAVEKTRAFVYGLNHLVVARPR